MKSTKHFLFFAAALMPLVWGCSKKSDPSAQTPDPTPALAIAGFSPASAVVGASVTITGAAFGTDANTVGIKFGNSAVVHPSTITATQLTVNVPQDATTGTITVAVGSATATSAGSFTVNVPQPVLAVTNFTPASGAIGTTVTITGTVFGADANAVNIKFGSSVAVHPATITATQLTVVVPQGATTGSISVTIGSSTATSANSFMVTVPDYSTYNTIASASTAQLSVARSGFACAAAGTKIVFAGGSTDGVGGGLSKVVDIYDVVTKTWTTAQLSEARYQLAAASAGNKIVFAGGTSATSGYSKTVDIYDVSTNAWTTAQLSEGRTSLAGTGSGNKIYFGGGANSATSVSTTIDIYDVTTNTWAVSQLPRGRRNLAAASTNGKVVFAGGMDEARNNLGILDVYDVLSNTWATRMIGAYGHTIAAANGGKIFITGDSAFTADVFDVASLTTTTLYFSVQTYNPAIASAGTKIAVAVGYAGSTVISFYDVITGAWTTSHISQGRNGLIGASLADQMLFAGGTIGSATLATVDIFSLTKQ